MRKLFLFLALTAGVIVFADEHQFHIDFLYYDLIDATHEAHVVPPDAGTYMGPQDVVIPDTILLDYNNQEYVVTRIDNNAFVGSTDLVNITIPTTVTEIEYDAFNSCENLVSVTILGDGLKTIGDNAFATCVNLAEVHLPNSVTHIGMMAFIDCQSLTEIDLPDSLEFIGVAAFEATEVKKIELPATIKTIEESAFEGLTSIRCKATTPPATDAYAFPNTDDDIPVYVPTGTIDAYSATSGWSDFNNFIDRSNLNDVFAYEYKGNTLAYQISNIGEVKEVTLIDDGDAAHQPSGDVVIPNTVTDWWGVSYRVSSIAQQVFRNNTNITSLDFSETEYITSVPRMMCMSCSNLATLTLSDKITLIRDYAFYGCPLTALDLKNVEEIQSASFSNNAITELVIPKSVKTIGDQTHLFANLTSLTCDPANETFVAIDNAIYNIDTTKIIVVAGMAPNDLHIPVTVTEAATSALQNFQNTVYFNSEVAMTRSWTNSPSGPVVVGCGLYTYYTSGNFVGDNNSFKYIQSLTESLLYSITATTDAGGSVAVLDTASCNEVRIEATPADGYKFVNWDNGETDNPLTVTVAQDTSVKANFAQLISAINATVTYPQAGEVAGTGASIDWEGDMLSAGYTVWSADGLNNLTAEVLEPNTNYILQISFYPREGYLFDNDVTITVNGEVVADKITANVEQQTIRLSFTTTATSLDPYGDSRSEEPSTFNNTHSTLHTQKVLRDGQLFLIRDGRTYNAQGVELK